jgi:hypothetical protein
MRRTVPALAVLAVVFALTGCHPPTPSKMRGWPDTRPVFSSEEEALAAAEEAYREYVRVADQIFVEGGAHPERLAEVATGEQLATELTGFAEIAASGYRSTGGTLFDQLRIQSVAPPNVNKAAVIVYLCEDVSFVDVLDSSGRSVVSASRPNRVTYEVSFDLVAPRRPSLVVSLKVPWSDAC